MPYAHSCDFQITCTNSDIQLLKGIQMSGERAWPAAINMILGLGLRSPYRLALQKEATSWPNRVCASLCLDWTGSICR